LEQIQRNFH